MRWLMWSIRFCSLALIGVIVYFATGISYTYIEKAGAIRLLALLSDVKVGTTTETALREKLVSFSRFRESEDGNQAKNDAFDQYRFTNRLFWHVFPAKWVWITFSYKDGIVQSKSVQFAVEPRISGIVTETIDIPEYRISDEKQGGGERRVFTREDPSHGSVLIKVSDDRTVPLSRRALDWQLDLSCLTQIKTCTDMRKVLRGAFTELPFPR